MIFFFGGVTICRSPVYIAIYFIPMFLFGRVLLIICFHHKSLKPKYLAKYPSVRLHINRTSERKDETSKYPSNKSVEIQTLKMDQSGT